MTTKTKKPNLKLVEQPLVYMTPEKRRRIFLSIENDLNGQILSEPFQTRLVIVRDMRTGKPVQAEVDHGDNEGLSRMEEFVADCIEQGHVKPGDLRVEVGGVLS